VERTAALEFGFDIADQLLNVSNRRPFRIQQVDFNCSQLSSVLDASGSEANRQRQNQQENVKHESASKWIGKPSPVTPSNIESLPGCLGMACALDEIRNYSSLI